MHLDMSIIKNDNAFLFPGHLLGPHDDNLWIFFSPLFLVFRRKDHCEAKKNVECSKKHSKLCFTLKRSMLGEGGGGKV